MREARSGRAYVLVTPVRDEAATLARTIRAVTGQTVLPREWIIVSDGSTDGTNDIVAEAAGRHPWIRLLALPSRPQRSFAAVVRNTELGVSALECADYQYLGLLDGDLDFQADYFETVIQRFEGNRRLGLAGGVVIDHGLPRDRFPHNRIDVPGAVQFFRRECFEGLNGLIAIPEGGWDCLTCAVARMRGFETELFTDLVVDHLKPRSAAAGSPLRRLWQFGVRDHAIGYDPWFELFKCLSRIGEPPAAIASLMRWFGYCAAAIRRRPTVVPADVVAFVRHEQRQRLRRLGRRGAGRPLMAPDHSSQVRAD